MNKFITLTDASTHRKVVVNTHNIAYMEENKNKYTIIYFVSALSTDLACVVVKEAIEDVQRKMYL